MYFMIYMKSRLVLCTSFVGTLFGAVFVLFKDPVSTDDQRRIFNYSCRNERIKNAKEKEREGEEREREK